MIWGNKIFLHSQWKYKLVQSFWSIMWQCLINTWITCYDSAISLLGICPEKLSHWKKVICRDDIQQRFSTTVQQKFFQHTISEYLVRDTDLFSLKWSNKKLTMVNATIVSSVNELKLHLFFHQISKKYIFWCTTAFQ